MLCSGLRSGRTPRVASGYTLLEVSLSATLFAVISVGSIAFFRGAMDSMQETADVAKQSNRDGAGLELLHRDLERSDPEHLRIDTSSPEADTLELQVVIGLDANGPIWGAAVPGCRIDGGMRRDWSIRYEVDGKELVRVFLDHEGSRTPYREVLISNLPERTIGKVFAVQRPDPTNAPMLLSFEVMATTKEGVEYKSTELSTSVRIGGTGTETLRVAELGLKLVRR